jgi:hypothetical protein
MGDHRLLHVSVGVVRRFALGPCGVTFCHCPGSRVIHVPGLWRKPAVAFAVDFPWCPRNILAHPETCDLTRTFHEFSLETGDT